MFWIGLIIGVLILLGIVLILRSNLQVKWWQWLIAAVAVLFLFMAVQHFYGSLAENEVKGAWIGLAIFGVVAIILGAVAVVFVSRNRVEN